MMGAVIMFVIGLASWVAVVTVLFQDDPVLGLLISIASVAGALAWVELSIN